jgi:hypothetical protein
MNKGLRIFRVYASRCMGAAPEGAVYWHYWHFHCRFIGTELALFYHHPVWAVASQSAPVYAKGEVPVGNFRFREGELALPGAYRDISR